MQSDVPFDSWHAKHLQYVYLLPSGLNTTPKRFHDSYLFFLIIDTHMSTSTHKTIKKLQSLYYIFTTYTNTDGYEGGIIPQVLYRNQFYTPQ